MRKLILIIIALTTLLLTSCNEGLPQERLTAYKGGIIYEKVNVPHHLLYTILINNKLVTVHCYEAEFIYNVRDTIK